LYFGFIIFSSQTTGLFRVSTTEICVHLRWYPDKSLCRRHAIPELVLLTCDFTDKWAYNL